MRNSTICYIEKDGCWLMLHRVKKKVDINKDKWIGVGGGFWENESPEDCIRRETREETGLTLGQVELCGLVTFVDQAIETQHMFLFRCSDFTGNVGECDEGELVWVPKEEVFSLPIWEGDRIFLRKMEENRGFFTLKLVYGEGGKLLSAMENGEVELCDTKGVPS